MNLKENKTENNIHAVTPGEEPRKLTDSGKAGQPTWSPCGEYIAYTEGEDEGTGIWVMTRDGEHKRKLTVYQNSNASLGINTVGDTLKWSPDGSKIAFLATLDPYDKDAKIRVIDRLMFKAFYGYSDMRRRHIFTVPVTANQHPTQLTYGDCDEHSIEWTPDGKLIFVSNRTARARRNS